jgi:hypothetical protein
MDLLHPEKGIKIDSINKISAESFRDYKKANKMLTGITFKVIQAASRWFGVTFEYDSSIRRKSADP